MNKYKVVVYAISKNEEKFVNRWYESMKEADEIYVLDTGSKDNTVSILKSLGVNVSICEINPWRFDVARNKSLELVPRDTDICVCTDLDEVFNKGWRSNLEKSWGECDRLKYVYNWSHDINGKPTVTFLYDKIHKRNGYTWIYPVHEVLSCSFKEKYNINKNIVLDHYPDSTKSRSSYLDLLKLARKENPHNDRIMHYLGREYMFHGDDLLAIKTLKKHLKLKNAKWDVERCASMRFIARCYIRQGKYKNALKYLKMATLESPNTREPFVELARFYYIKNDYLNVINACLKAKQIKENPLIYITEPFCYDNTIDDLLSLSYYYLGLKEEALFYVDKALEYDSTNERLLNNKKIFQS